MVNVEYQSFCHNAVMVATDEMKAELEKRFSGINLFPQFKQRAEDLEFLDEKYLITEKMKTATPFILYLTRMNRDFLTFLIDIQDIRSPKVYLLNLRFDHKLYRDFGTLFHTELVYNTKDCWVLLLGDILFNSGVPVAHKSLPEKLSMMSDILKRQYTRDDFMNPFYIQLKSFFPYNHLENVNKTTTLQFYPDNPRRYIMEVEFVIEEEKDEEYPDKEYKIVSVEDTPDVYKIYDEDTFVDVISVKTLKESTKLREIFKGVTETTRECTYNKETGEWNLKE